MQVKYGENSNGNVSNEMLDSRGEHHPLIVPRLVHEVHLSYSENCSGFRESLLSQDTDTNTNN